MDRMVDTAWDQGTRLAAAGVSFVPADLLARLDDVRSDELDGLAFAAVRLDDAGVVQLTNEVHDRFVGAGSTTPIGRDWFFDVAPCTSGRLFRGLFRRGVAEGRMDLYFFYAFTVRMAPTDTRVHLHRTAGGANWVFLQPA